MGAMGMHSQPREIFANEPKQLAITANLEYNKRKPTDQGMREDSGSRDKRQGVYLGGDKG
jgi:hypothetical protein